VNDVVIIKMTFSMKAFKSLLLRHY